MKIEKFTQATILFQNGAIGLVDSLIVNEPKTIELQDGFIAIKSKYGETYYRADSINAISVCYYDQNDMVGPDVLRKATSKERYTGVDEIYP